MPRYPTLRSSGGILRGLDYMGTAVFAIGGCVTAGAVSGMDLLGCCAVGTITAIGGGTIRDAIILRKQPFWVEETEYLAICLAAAGATFFAWPYLEKQYGVTDDHPLLLIGDAFGVAAFCVIGAQNGIRMGVPAGISALCGMATGTFGGMTRDVLCRQPARILHSKADIYATTALAGASAYLFARALAAPLGVRIAAGVGTTVAMRYGAWKYGWRLPEWFGART